MTTQSGLNSTEIHNCKTIGQYLSRDKRARARGCVPATPSPARAARACAYLRCLRAAEMATWEMTGGDYVSSRFVSQL